MKTVIFKKGVWALAAVLLLAGCAETSKFIKGDIKDDFCGAYINFQYCKCAFHNEYCDSVGMKKSEAKKYVNEQYRLWVDGERTDFQERCQALNGLADGDVCTHCPSGTIAWEGRCQEDSEELRSAIRSEDGPGGTDEEMLEDDGADEDEPVCRYDSDCDPICEGNVAWKMGCNPREDICEKTFDNDCAAVIDRFGEEEFPQACSAGECVRDDAAIAARRAALEAEKQMWSDAVKGINASRDNITAAMMEANKNCINGIADMTNVAIMEFSTRIASVLAGGIPDIAKMAAKASEHAAGLVAENMKNLANAAVDYAGESLNRLYNYQQGEPPAEAEKLKPHEYIKLNCDLYEYFKQVLAESDADLDTAINSALEADQSLRALSE